MRRTWLLAASLGMAALLAAPMGVVAQDGADGKKKPDTVEVTEGSKTRLERARELVKTLERARDLLKKDGKLDAKLEKEFADAIAKAREMTKPITADELTEKEKRSLAKELGKDEGKRDEGGYMSRLEERLLSRAFEGAGLSEEQEIEATKVISTWYKNSMSARGDGDSKKVSDLKRQRDAELKKMLGRRKASKVINNINSMSGRKRY